MPTQSREQAPDRALDVLARVHRLAYEHGATLSGVVRKLIRDASQRLTTAQADDREVRYASGR